MTSDARGRRRINLQWLLWAALLVLVAGCDSGQQAGSAVTPASPPVATGADNDPAPVAAPGNTPAAVAAVASLNGSFDPARDPASDLQAAIAAARHGGKRIILDVGGEWCPWCKRMDAFVQSDADIRGLRDARFVWMKVNYSEENENAAFLSQFPKVKGYPHLFVLDADGKLLHSQFTGGLEEGKSYDRDEFFAFLKKWAPGSSDS